MYIFVKEVFFKTTLSYNKQEFQNPWDVTSPNTESKYSQGSPQNICLVDFLLYHIKIIYESLFFSIYKKGKYKNSE